MKKMKDFKIASHDTMTYLKPKAWYLRPFHFVAKCQSKTLREQYDDYGIRMFDIRIRYNRKEQKWELAHGAMVFKGETPESVLEYLSSKNNPDIYVRILMEYNKAPKDVELLSTLFTVQMSKWVRTYTNIKFFGFQRKYDWAKLFNYDGEPHPSIYQATSSTTWKIIDDWWPWLYAHAHNKDILKQGTCSDYLMMDFIGMYWDTPHHHHG